MIISATIKAGDRIHTGKQHNEIGFSGERGFITDYSVFLSRTDAAKHAFECGQISVPKYMLYSDDVDLRKKRSF